MYNVSTYRPKMEPATPITVTAQIFSLKAICNGIIIENAGGKGIGTTSNTKAPAKTNK